MTNKTRPPASVETGAGTRSTTTNSRERAACRTSFVARTTEGSPLSTRDRNRRVPWWSRCRGPPPQLGQQRSVMFARATSRLGSDGDYGHGQGWLRSAAGTARILAIAAGIFQGRWRDWAATSAQQEIAEDALTLQQTVASSPVDDCFGDRSRRRGVLSQLDLSPLERLGEGTVLAPDPSPSAASRSSLSLGEGTFFQPHCLLVLLGQPR